MKNTTKTLIGCAVLTLFATSASAELYRLNPTEGSQAHFSDIQQMAMNELPATHSGPKQKMDIVDTAISAGSFKTLVTAIQEAGLVETLKGDGPFTVFAPTDEAFAKVPEETLQALLADKQALTEVLTYHVVAGKVMSQDVVNLSSAKTVQGQSVTIDSSNGVMVDNAKVISADIETGNGVIHVIDSVILPKS